MKKISKIDPVELWGEIELNASKKSRGAEERTSSLPEARPSGPNATVGGKHNLEAAKTEHMDLDVGENSTPSTTTDSPSLPAVIVPPTTTSTTQIVRRPFPDNLSAVLDVILGHNGKAYSVRHEKGNLYVLEVGSRALNNIIREIGQEEGQRLRRADIGDINEILLAQAERSGVIKKVWYRVAKIENGVLIDIGDDKHTRVKIAPDSYEIVKSGSETLFFRTPFCQPMAMPEEC